MSGDHPSKRAPRIAISSGEPAGIGPDLCLLLSQYRFMAQLVVFADPNLLERRARQLGMEIDIQPWVPTSSELGQEGKLFYQPVMLASREQVGVVNKNNAHYVIEMLESATSACLGDTFDAIVTAPVHKGIINEAGYPFSGHTEWLGQRCGGDPVMLLSGGGLRVALITTHIPLCAVSPCINTECIIRVLRILDHDLKVFFAIPKPRLAICGLNPHAGEGGYLGDEEINHIIPAIKQAQLMGIDAVGPLPADSVFVPERSCNFDVVVAMYHDQGLPALKFAAKGAGVNITLGLPIVRTSVDHGTALEIAGHRERINVASMVCAVETAIDLAQRRNSLRT